MAIVATSTTESLLMDTANTTLLQVSNWLQQRRLALESEEEDSTYKLLLTRNKYQTMQGSEVLGSLARQ